MTALLEVRGLATGFGANRVLNGLDLDAEEGRATLLLGLNGAGKSVALKTISGLQPAWSGSIRLSGRELVGLEAEDRIRGGMGHVLQSKAVFGQLTVAENLRLGGATVRDRRRVAENMERVYTIYPRLRERASQQAGSLSGGEQAMLAVARALMAGPRLLLVDEPSAGLSPIMVEALGHTLGEIRKTGTTLLMVEQNVGFGLELADDVYVLEKGRVVYRGAAGELDLARVSALLGIGELLGPPKPTPAPRPARTTKRAAGTTKAAGATKAPGASRARGTTRTTKADGNGTAPNGRGRKEADG